MLAWLLAASALAAPPASPPRLDAHLGPFEAVVEPDGRRFGGEAFTVRFPSPMKSRFPSNDTVWAHFYVPEGRTGPLPTILVVPVMAAPNLWIEERFVKRFVAEGFAVLLMEGPYQFHRRPHPSQPSGQVFLARTAPRLAANFRQSVLDARRCLDWLSKDARVDSKRVGIFGVSLGGMVSALVYSIDPRVKHATFLLAGADFPALAQNSSMTAAFLRKAGIGGSELRQAWTGIDPLDYPAANGDKRPLLINARWDRVIPRANADALRRAFPKARQEWVSGGHYSAILHLLWVPGRVAREFKERL